MCHSVKVTWANCGPPGDKVKLAKSVATPRLSGSIYWHYDDLELRERVLHPFGDGSPCGQRPTHATVVLANDADFSAHLRILLRHPPAAAKAPEAARYLDEEYQSWRQGDHQQRNH